MSRTTDPTDLPVVGKPRDARGRALGPTQLPGALARPSLHGLAEVERLQSHHTT